MAKVRTNKQDEKHYRNIEWGCLGAEFISTITPFVAVGLANYNKYFVEYDGTKMSIAFFIACALMGFAIVGITQKKLENTYISFIMKWAIVATIFTLLGQIINDIAMIMWFGLIGLVVAQGFEFGRTAAEKKKLYYKDVLQEARKQNDIERAKEEDKQAKIKIKIKN